MTDIIIDLIARGGYIGIFLLMALENIIPPIPSEVIMGLGGMAVARGQMDLWWLIFWATMGTTAGNLFWYELGRRLGIQRFKPLVDRYSRWMTMEWEDVEHLNRFFQKYGHWVIFVFRFLPTFRTVISLPAGMAKMSMWKFLLFTFTGSAIWNSVLAGAGLFLGLKMEQLEKFVGPLAVGTVIAIVLLYFYRVFTWKPREQRG
ncbi:DedA family protein [Sphingomonas sp. IC-11]|uniref:DedA family protein n=1 Tax=Sphingomonas sp. IC-11 TaxID=2898528 RepID=UPI001E2D1846|nr:DedA family protein [Sphingomonas sp. IC-11]MCD2316213.1 DedA family protein [Sphingomonas sp. IC-11]